MRRYENNTDGTINERVNNKNYENDIKRALQYTQWTLTFLGVWPMITEFSSKYSKYISISAILTCLSFILFTFIPSAVHVIFGEVSALNRVILMGPCFAGLGSVVKFAFILLRANTIEMCLNKMRKDWMLVENEDERAIMTRNATIGRGITIVCSVFLYSGGMSYHTMMPIFKGAKINEFNVTIRPLVYPGFDVFMDAQASPTYEIISFLTCISAFIRYSVTIGSSSLAAVFVSHACGQIQIVMLQLDRLFDEIERKLSEDELQKRISRITQGHVSGLRDPNVFRAPERAILKMGTMVSVYNYSIFPVASGAPKPTKKLSSTIDDGLRELCLIEVMSSTLSICLLEYSCMKAWQSSNLVTVGTYSMLLVSYVFIVFIFCHIGELLQEQYHTVGNTAYMVEWYRLPGKQGLSLIMVMAMASYPRKLTAGRMLDLTIRNFGAIMRTSITYLNMLRATTS